MASTTFQQNTLVTPEWLNEANDLVWQEFTASSGAPVVKQLKIASGLIGVSGDFYQALGVASVTDTGTGLATVNFLPNFFLNSSYSVTVTPVSDTTALTISIPSATKMAGSFRIECRNSATGALTDPAAGYCFIAIGAGQ